MAMYHSKTKHIQFLLNFSSDSNESLLNESSEDEDAVLCSWHLSLMQLTFSFSIGKNLEPSHFHHRKITLKTHKFNLIIGQI